MSLGVHAEMRFCVLPTVFPLMALTVRSSHFVPERLYWLCLDFPFQNNRDNRP